MDEDVHCDVGTVGLELGDQENKEGGKEGGKQTILQSNQQICTVRCEHTYKNEHSICQISPLDLPDVVFHCGHFVVVFPYRLFIPKGLWEYMNIACVIPFTEQLTEQPGHDYSNPILVFGASELSTRNDK